MAALSSHPAKQVHGLMCLTKPRRQYRHPARPVSRPGTSPIPIQPPTRSVGSPDSVCWTYLEPGSPVLRFPPYQEMKISTASTAIRTPIAVASMHYSLSITLQQSSPRGDVSCRPRVGSQRPIDPRRAPRAVRSTVIGSYPIFVRSSRGGARRNPARIQGIRPCRPGRSSNGPTSVSLQRRNTPTMPRSSAGDACVLPHPFVNLLHRMGKE